MCTPGGAAATAKGIGTIGDGHWDISERQNGRFGVFFCLFCLEMHPAARVKQSIGGAQHLK